MSVGYSGSRLWGSESLSATLRCLHFLQFLEHKISQRAFERGGDDDVDDTRDEKNNFFLYLSSKSRKS